MAHTSTHHHTGTAQTSPIYTNAEEINQHTIIYISTAVNYYLILLLSPLLSTLLSSGHSSYAPLTSPEHTHTHIHTHTHTL